ncbi:MAG TPA: GPP34 family phosphoprotein [Micromonosporaceae bacterium]|nr:GPP34 family phosphoprotein [Micromonosporaceae bacterium]
MHERLKLRDDLFLIAHDEERGFRPRIHLPALGVGLTGAVLIELLQAHRIAIDQGHIVPGPAHTKSSTGDRVYDHLMQTFAATGAVAVPMAELLPATGRYMFDQVRDALLATNVLVPPRRHRLALPRKDYQPADPTQLVVVRARPRFAVQGSDDDDLSTQALCGLLRVLGLEEALYFPTLRYELRDRLDAVAQRIGRRAGADAYTAAIPQVIEAVDLAVGDLAVAVYR